MANSLEGGVVALEAVGGLNSLKLSGAAAVRVSDVEKTAGVYENSLGAVLGDEKEWTGLCFGQLPWPAAGQATRLHSAGGR